MVGRRCVAAAAAFALVALGAGEPLVADPHSKNWRATGPDRDDWILMQTSFANLPGAQASNNSMTSGRGHRRYWPSPRLVMRAVAPHLSTYGALGGALAWPSDPLNASFTEQFLRSDALVLRLHGDEQGWLVAFCASVFVLYSALWVASFMLPGPPPIKGAATGATIAHRGRACWNDFCIVVILLLSVGIFFAVVAEVEAANERTLMINDSGQEPTREQRLEINNPGSRGFEAAMSLALSVAFISYCLLSRRSSDAVRITGSMLWQFALRGATFGILIALVLEITITLVMLPMFGGDTTEGFNIATAFVMMVVGISEEFAKAVILAANTSISIGHEDANVPGTEQTLRSERDTCWCYVCDYMTLLVESPKALVLAGFAVGGGFMTGENVMYISAIATETPIIPADELGEEMMTEREVRTLLAVTGILALLVRVLLNIHPWLAGVSAGRLARIVFHDENKHARRHALDITCKEFIWCIYPSVIVHAAYDFILVTGMLGIFTLLVPLIFFLMSHRMFRSEWHAIDVDAEAIEYEARHPKSPRKQPIT